MASIAGAPWLPGTTTTIAPTSRRPILNEIKPIGSEADYEAALAEVERLWGAPSGTPKGDRLHVLAALIDAYESEHHPIDPPDPIEAIKFRMEQQAKGASIRNRHHMSRARDR
jgi:HTH-type transcriptional regulator/antitoxin HigA